ncbi:hypothetical protein JD844_019834 [Phrynosoma platyrhinos]|uniref:VWFA domain-containing protein n=1 Tax=Phrynosoma platyrhinos TaxID=52577 RepID=A0ABQ7TQ60_PHRPL|nr:hypothetical protein JD844_019834 [Phrynosoma platyrhinos]
MVASVVTSNTNAIQAAFGLNFSCTKEGRKEGRKRAWKNEKLVNRNPNILLKEKMARLLDNELFFQNRSTNPESNFTSPKGRRSWQNVSITDFQEDNGLLVTNINQTQDLLRLKNTAVLFAGLKATDNWVKVYGLENMHLTLENLIKKGNVVLNASDGTEHIEFTKEVVHDFETQLLATIDMYDKRIQWLLQGSRKMFGVIQGSKIGVLIDTSNISCKPRLREFQRDLLSLIDEQLCYMKKLYFVSFGTEASSFWEQPQAISVNVLHEARQWVQELKPSGGCNLLKALKKVLVIKELDSLVIIVGSCPDQSPGILSDYIQQGAVGRDLLVHTVTYDCSSQVPPGSMECLQVSSATSLPKLPKHESPLGIQSPNLLARSSAEWLKTYGLKAKKLSLYQVLAPNAFSPVEEFVPVLQKTVSSTLHEKAMMQFEWHDGTIKNVHVDPPILYDYQKQLGRIVKMYERRIDWLSIGSRRIWGTVGERRVVILVDIAKANSIYIIHIQHSLRLLLEEQMSSKDCFNIIAFGNTVKAWQPEMVPPHPDNLQSAWKWVLTLQCEGTRNVMNALRRAVEVDFREKDKHESQSLYLLTTGVPDQEMHAICSYMTEVCGGCTLQLHVCLFSVNGFPIDEDIPPRYASPHETAAAFKEIVQSANGRFHWFGETGIYESDDISLILSEMEKAVSYSHKCALLVESLRQRARGQLGNQSIPEEDLAILEKEEKKSRPQKLPSPKPTALSLARMFFFAYPPEPIAQALLHQLNCLPDSENCAVYKKYSNPKYMRKLVPKVILPQEEEICSSKEWLSKFSIKKLKLELSSLIFGPESRHQKRMVESLHKQVSAKYCDIFPSVEMHDLEDYIEQMEKVLRCYVRRLQFNLISFAEDVEVWQECLVEATDEACHDATQWVSGFRAHGNTSILKALRRAFSLQDIEALYILTDGKPDTSCNLVLNEIEMLRKKRAVTIHTISFNCTDRAANDFLKKLAFRTGGRYHQCHGDVDGQLAAHRLLSEGFKDEDDPVFPLFEGDDLKKLAEEIAKARNYLTQARFFRPVSCLTCLPHCQGVIQDQEALNHLHPTDPGKYGSPSTSPIKGLLR